MATQVKTQSMYKRYFVYSTEEETLRKKIYGAGADFGTISVHGVPKRYTSIVTDLNATKPDAIMVWQGDIRKAHYTPAKS